MCALAKMIQFNFKSLFQYSKDILYSLILSITSTKLVPTFIYPRRPFFINTPATTDLSTSSTTENNITITDLIKSNIHFQSQEQPILSLKEWNELKPHIERLNYDYMFKDWAIKDFENPMKINTILGVFYPPIILPNNLHTINEDTIFNLINKIKFLMPNKENIKNEHKIKLLNKMYMLNNFIYTFSVLKPQLGYHLPNRAELLAMTLFIKNDKVLSLFVDCGLIEALLRKRGLEIKVIHCNLYKSIPIEWTHIEYLDFISAIDKYSNCNVLIMCWPPQRIDENDECEAYRAIKQFKGQKFIFIGQIVSKTFYNYVKFNFKEIRSGCKSINCNNAIQSKIYFYVRKEREENEVVKDSALIEGGDDKNMDEEIYYL